MLRFYVSAVDKYMGRVMIVDRQDNSSEILYEDQLRRIVELGISVDGMHKFSHGAPKDAYVFMDGRYVVCASCVRRSIKALKFEVLCKCKFIWDKRNILQRIDFEGDVPKRGSLRLSDISRVFCPRYMMCSCNKEYSGSSDFTLIFDKDLWYANFALISPGICNNTAIYKNMRACDVKLDLREANEFTRESFVQNAYYLVDRLVYDRDLMLKCIHTLVFNKPVVFGEKSDVLQREDLDKHFCDAYEDIIIRDMRKSKVVPRVVSKAFREQFLNCTVANFFDIEDLLPSGVSTFNYKNVINYYKLGGRSEKILHEFKIHADKLFQLAD